MSVCDPCVCEQENGMTPLTSAALGCSRRVPGCRVHRESNVECVRMLVGAAANINSRDEVNIYVCVWRGAGGGENKISPDNEIAF